MDCLRCCAANYTNELNRRIQPQLRVIWQRTRFLPQLPQRSQNGARPFPRTSPLASRTGFHLLQRTPKQSHPLLQWLQDRQLRTPSPYHRKRDCSCDRPSQLGITRNHRDFPTSVEFPSLQNSPALRHQNQKSSGGVPRSQSWTPWRKVLFGLRWKSAQPCQLAGGVMCGGWGRNQSSHVQKTWMHQSDSCRTVLFQKDWNGKTLSPSRIPCYLSHLYSIPQKKESATVRKS